MQAHTLGGPWFKPNTDSAAGISETARGSVEEMPVCGEQTATRALLFLFGGLPVCVCSHELFSPLRNTLPFLTTFYLLVKIAFLQSPLSQGLSLVWRLGSALSLPQQLQSWPGTEVLFQVAAGRGHLRSRPIRNLWYFRWGLVIQLGASYHIMRRVWGDDQTTRFQRGTFNGPRSGALKIMLKHPSD